MVDHFRPYIAFLKVQHDSSQQIVTRIVKFYLDDITTWPDVAVENSVPSHFVEKMYDVASI